MAEQIRDRSVVPVERRPWSVGFPEYGPVDVGLVQGAAGEPDDPREVANWGERQREALVPFEVFAGVPFHPFGRTGRRGREAKRWGENACADALVLAGTGADRRALMIRRGDCDQWAIPGGGVDRWDESPVATALRELGEETGVVIDPDSDEVRVFDLGSMVVDDPRNTDHAWFATTLVVILIDTLVLATGADDAVEARWVTAENLEGLVSTLPGELYQAHHRLLAEAFCFLDQLQRLPAMVLGDRSRLVHAVRSGARGDIAEEAAVELLIQHGVWLERADFPAAMVRLVDPNPDVWVQTAVIAWDRVLGGLESWAATGSERLVLQIAAGLAAGASVDVSEMSRLDHNNLRLVLTAIAHAARGSDAARSAVSGGFRGWWG